mgnify:CR=1 FL=1
MDSKELIFRTLLYPNTQQMDNKSSNRTLFLDRTTWLAGARDEQRKEINFHHPVPSIRSSTSHPSKGKLLQASVLETTEKRRRGENVEQNVARDFNYAFDSHSRLDRI